jgi:nucleotide-binding universal stress UspA family protein
MKNVLLLVHDDAGQEARLQVALDVTRAVEGHLHCLDVALVPPMVDCPYDGVGQALIIDDERRTEQANKTKLEARLQHEHVPWTWQDATGAFAPLLADAAMLADVIILNRKLDSAAYPDMRATAAEVLLEAAKPIIAVPDTARSFPVAGRAMIAWDGSPQAAAALRAAVPLLRLAEAVILLEIDDGSIETSAEEAALYLSNYGIHPRTIRDSTLAQPVGKMLLLAIAAQKADYLVMGGYGHWRATEALFGGATRTMLDESPVPVFLAHG